MRIEIKTKGRISSRDIKALYLIIYSLDHISTPRMRKANLEYIVDRCGYKLVKKIRVKLFGR
ncbi:hypothetical protein LCGC14_2433530 [marine sediment metagenome]|uniref:Uncharacterized protein n=1 Tax=marine sediment metagenome TaxID=412755 RepID=A0A0F9BLA3_9ZZZZ